MRHRDNALVMDVAGSVLIMGSLWYHNTVKKAAKRDDLTIRKDRAWQELVYLASGKERKVFKKIKTAEELSDFMAEFWKKRDPNPATPENEMEEAYLRRLAYANENFHEHRREGWETERAVCTFFMGRRMKFCAYLGSITSSITPSTDPRSKHSSFGFISSRRQPESLQISLKTSTPAWSNSFSPISKAAAFSHRFILRKSARRNMRAFCTTRRKSRANGTKQEYNCGNTVYLTDERGQHLVRRHRMLKNLKQEALNTTDRLLQKRL